MPPPARVCLYNRDRRALRAGRKAGPPMRRENRTDLFPAAPRRIGRKEVRCHPQNGHLPPARKIWSPKTTFPLA